MLVTTKIGNYTVGEIQAFLANNIEGYKILRYDSNDSKQARYKLFHGNRIIKDEDGIMYEWDNIKDAYAYLGEYIMDETDPKYLQKVISGQINKAKIEALETQINDIKQERERLDLMISGLIKELNTAKKGE